MMVRHVAKSMAAIAIAVLCLFLSGLPATAQPIQTPHVEVQLVNELEAVRPGDPFWVGLQFQIEDGWHIYWRNPGDSGAKPTVDWTVPPGVEVGDFIWPYPERLAAGPLLNFGYEDEVLLPLQGQLPAQYDASDVTLRGEAYWLVCQLACIPEEGVLELTLPVSPDGTAPPSLWAEDFDLAQQRVPRESPWPISAQLSSDLLTLHVEYPHLQTANLESVSFFPDSDGVIVNAAEQIVETTKTGLTLDMQRGYLPDFEAVTGVLTLTELVDKVPLTQAFVVDTAVESVAAAPISSDAEIATPSGSVSLWSALGLALLGGMTLNVMPCVFPVLSLKALGILREAGQHPQRVRLRSLWYAAGISVSVLAISAGVLLLRSLGQQVGWGFQLQAPGFVLVMAYLMFGVGLNFSGVFEVNGAFAGVGQRLTERSGYWGDFFTGVFATVVATPCTAPFMATAIGVALTQPAWVAIAIFQMLGLGLALPYVFVSFVPAIQSRLPKPGAWMVVARQALAFPLYAAAAWLVWVLTQQTGSQGLAIASGGLIAIAFAAWLYRTTRTGGRWGQRTGAIVASLTVGVAIAIAQVPTPLSVTSIVPTSTAVDVLAWEPYSPQTLADYRQAGRPVFVNFAADWCITCLVNDRLTLSQPEVVEAFAANEVAYLKADWTNRNPTVTEALAEFGRAGVPLYVFYPSEAEPVVLPQVLSADRLQRVLTESG
ncbi:MAG: thioredoxin family protein [Cyanobacteria bacterium P01_D01_bin.123]